MRKAIVFLLLAACATPIGEPVPESWIALLAPQARILGRVHRALDAESAARIEAALDDRLSESERNPEIVEAALPDRAAWIAMARGRGPHGPLAVAVLITRDPQGRAVLRGVHVFEHSEPPGAFSEAFLSRFSGIVATSSAYNPVSRFESVAAGARDPIAALLAQRETMKYVRETDDYIKSLIVAKDPKLADVCETLIHTYRGMALAGRRLDACFSAERSRAQYEASTEPVIEALSNLQQAAAAGDFEEVRKTMGRYVGSCAACHNPFMNYFREERERCGIGDGYLLLGHELPRSPSDFAESRQALARIVRKAMLIADRSGRS